MIGLNGGSGSSGRSRSIGFVCDSDRRSNFRLAARVSFASIGLEETGVVDESTAVVEESFANIGATIMGRNMFGGHPGGWDAADPWMGWWGDEPPFHHPVFVLTHHEREPLELKGTTFTFVTDGAESALAQAREAAGDKRRARIAR